MECPRRAEVPHQLTQPPDSWRDDSTCSFCGSLNPDFALEQLEAGARIEPTDKNYKAYVGERGKLYYQHFDESQCKRFIELLNSKKLNIAHPGHFYVLPFFIRRGS